MADYCKECYDYKHPETIRDYNGDNDAGWLTCGQGNTVKALSVNGCYSVTGDRGED